MLWLVTWPERPRLEGARRERHQQTVLADTSGQAFVHVVRQRPYVLTVAQEVRVEPYRTLAVRR
jgi:hypothetical protein